MKKKNNNKKKYNLHLELIKQIKKHFKIRMKINVGKSKKTHLLKKIKKKIAQIKTFLHNKVINNE
ncbi:MAG: 50S ribosomal protein L29 [Candidatus Makana argininalis]